MKTMTDHIATRITPDEANDALLLGTVAATFNRALDNTLKDVRERIAEARHANGAKRRWAPIMTPPDANKKLAKGSVPSYGITLHHYVHRSVYKALPTVNLCPKAGDCTKVCVVSNGHGNRDSVQAAWRWRTDLLAIAPWAFFFHLGWELERAVMKHGSILLRPNVNSDIEWEKVAPALVNGSIFGSAVKLYGYSKLPSTLDGDGWITPHYRVAYSWNEHTDPDQALAFVYRGGSIAVVTDRKPGDPVKQWDPSFTVMDADLTDEWIFKSGVIGDLSAKGRARKLIGHSDFVRTPYAAAPVTIKAGRDS